MPEEKKAEKNAEWKEHYCKKSSANCGGCIYGLAFIGALVYYIQQATNFQEGAIGFGKALLWPAFLLYRLLQFLQM